MSPEELILTRAQVRQLDRVAIDQFGIPGLVLMENAGRQLAGAVLAELTPGARVLIACGAGNNGGDGFVCARYLFDLGVAVTVLETAAASKLSPDAAVFQRVCTKLGVPALAGFETELLGEQLAQLPAQDWILDAVLGTGFAGALREPARSQLETLGQACARWGSQVIAVDTPSGLDVDTGQAAAETLPAVLTLTLAANKPAFVNPDAPTLSGCIQVLPIGLPRAVYETVL